MRTNFSPSPMSCCSGSGCGGCKAIKAIAPLLVTLATIAAAIGVWKTHATPSGWMFGSSDASLALLTFIVGLTVWVKLVTKMCPCHAGNKEMCAGGDHGGECGCK